MGLIAGASQHLSDSSSPSANTMRRGGWRRWPTRRARPSLSGFATARRLPTQRISRCRGIGPILAEAANAGLAIGGHARSHARLTDFTPDRQRDEIAGCRTELAELLGQPPSGFAYPHGDFDETTAALVREAGFAWAVVVGNRAVPAGADRYVLPRLTVGYWGPEQLRRAIRAAGG
jgi:peptidoglycan/xylan/chitin deacetylase (PgdA/CDA1 family)